MAFKVPNQFRVRSGALGSEDSAGNNGAFIFRVGKSRVLTVASDGGGWEHVSVSIVGESRCPIWDEMCAVKSLFWDDPQDYAVQYHPPASEYVNNHAYCLHLWSTQRERMPHPPSWMVGTK